MSTPERRELPPPGPDSTICMTPSIFGCDPTKRCLIITTAALVVLGGGALAFMVWIFWATS